MKHKEYQNLEFDLKIYDLETGFRKRGKDPAGKERKAETKYKGVSYVSLTKILTELKKKYGEHDPI